jgi:hypothetical protein
MILSHFSLLSLFVLSFLGNMEHVVAHPLVAAHVSAVRNSTHAHPLVVVLSLCFVCIFFMYNCSYIYENTNIGYI